MEDEAEFAAFTRETWGGLVRAAVFLGCSLTEAEDIAQTTLVRCSTSWDKVSGADSREAYVYRMLRNCLRDSRRRREVVVLRSFVQLSERQTADVLDVPPGTVKSRLSRALAQLAADSHLADLAEGTSS